MVLGIVFLGTATGTLHKYMDVRLRLAERQSRGGDRSVLQAIEELRAEIAALRQHESDAILSFDSTLHTLDARLKNVERQALGEGAAPSASLDAAAPRPEPELQRNPPGEAAPGVGLVTPSR
jgi:hypothetical protein